MLKNFIVVAIIAFFAAVSTPMQADANSPEVETIRVPHGGVQPQVTFDRKGVFHLVYMVGDASHSDIFHVRSVDGGRTFSAPVRVNSQPGSAIAMGTVRGAQLAIGREGWVHVAWLGSSTANPKAPGDMSPMLYSRSSDGGDHFEPQRNLIEQHPGLDGGGSVAADAKGNVFVAWHAPDHPGAGEQARRVWIAHSSDDGATFDAERPAADSQTGACGCCGMQMFEAANGNLYALYRSANQVVHRDMTLLDLSPGAHVATVKDIAPMNASTCIMSTAAFAQSGKDVLAAWETSGQVYWSKIDSATIEAIRAPGRGNNRKHPTLAVNSNGQILLAWTEDTSWNRGGSVAWQVFDANGNPIGSLGRARNLPVWGSPAAFARPDGTFVVIY